MGELRRKKRWKPEEITAILKRVLLDRVDVSKVCEEAGCCPSQVYRWQKTFFDQGAMVFERSNGSVDKRVKATEAKSAKLAAKLRRKDEVMTEQLRSTLDLVEYLESQIGPLDDELARRVEAIESPLPSLGLRAPIVATIHAESDPITDFRHPWQYAAFTGLDPSGFQTGQLTGTRARISKRGSPYLRRAYYLAAMCLYRRHAA